MDYTLLRGQFVIRYANLPRSGPQPDGDTVKFKPDNPALVDDLAQVSGIPPNINRRGISVRLEAIDALETHFNNKHQELTLANAARDQLLNFLGFRNVKFFDDKPNIVESANHNSLPGCVLSNGIDANGRLIGFVYEGDALPGNDGSTVTVTNEIVDQSANAVLLSSGIVFPAFYNTLPSTLRTHLATKARAARESGKGLWPSSAADKKGPAEVGSLSDLEDLVMWPKLFRRIVSFIGRGNTVDFDGFQAWLRQDSVHRDDKLYRLDINKPSALHEVVVAAGTSIQLTVWPEDLVIQPDPPSSA